MLESFSPRLCRWQFDAGIRYSFGLLLLVVMVGGAQAQQTQSMEERLRAQLRITTAQLQQAQNELAALKSAPATTKTVLPGAAAPQADLDALKKDLARAQAKLASERRASGGPSARQQNDAALEKVNAQLAQQRVAYEGALKLARAAEAERLRLTGETEVRFTALTQCEAKNAQLYAVSQEILHAYETIDMGTVIAARQPFAAQSRVKLEQTAQEFGDKLYEGRFDARSVTTPAQGAEIKAADGVAPAATPPVKAE